MAVMSEKVLARKTTLRDLKGMKAAGQPIAAATAYDYASIRLVEEAGIDMLVPDDWAMATTLLGQPGAEGVTIEHLLFYVQALGRLVQRAFILAPLPFGSYEVSDEDAIRNAARLIKAGADSVKLQGAGPSIERIRALAEMGIPVAGHLGYMPQQAKRLGAERVVGDTSEEAAQFYRDALALQAAGAWGVVLQNVPEPVAHQVTTRTHLITMGAGGTRGCAGYLVQTHDLTGWPQHIRPLFSEPYAAFFERALVALNRHCAEVQALQFPTQEHTFEIDAQEFRAFLQQMGEG